MLTALLWAVPPYLRSGWLPDPKVQASDGGGDPHQFQEHCAHESGWSSNPLLPQGGCPGTILHHRAPGCHNFCHLAGLPTPLGLWHDHRMIFCNRKLLAEMYVLGLMSVMVTTQTPGRGPWIGLVLQRRCESCTRWPGRTLRPV